MIPVQAIIDTYVIELIYDRLASEDKTVADFRLDEIKSIYLDGFRQLFVSQLKKYQSLNRTYGVNDLYKIFNNLENEPLHRFPYLFMLTLRGDVIRGNDRWVTIAENVVRLEQAKGKGITQAIDTLNSVIHNSGGSVLERFPNGAELLKTLNLKKVSSIGTLIALATSEIKRISEKV